MNALVPQNFGPLSARFAGVPIKNDLAAGVDTGFGIVGYRGKVWSIRWRGEEIPLMREDGDGPRASIEVVIIQSSSFKSKIFYEAGWVEGSSAPPDCYSNNGTVPEPGAVKKQAIACASCPKNVWGSRITPAGKQGKACSDSKRLAVVPLGDIANEAFGGPLLLRVPAASLQDMATYGDTIAHLGYHYFAVGTRISFDPQESYPKFLFNAIRPLTDDEAELVVRHQSGLLVPRILAENEFEAAAAAGPTPQTVFEQPPVQPAPVRQAPPAVAPVQAQPPVQPARVQPVAVQTPAPAAPVATQAPRPAPMGFGGAPVAKPAVQAPQPVQTPAPVAAQPAPAAAPQHQPQVFGSGLNPDAEAALDAALNEFLPK